MKFTGICIITKDVLRLTDFYNRILNVRTEGDAVRAEVYTDGAGISIFSEDGMEQMSLHSMKDAGLGNVTLGFEVGDVDLEYKRIKAYDVEIIMLPTTHPWGNRSFWFRDPDGNIIDFYTVLE